MKSRLATYMNLGRVILVSTILAVIVSSQGWAMNGVAAIKGGFLLAEIRGPDWRVRQFNRDGVLVRTVPLPSSGIGINAIASTEDSTTALIGYSGWSVEQVCCGSAEGNHLAQPDPADHTPRRRA